ncbi:MAG: hypothetical protein J6G98_01935 [Bacilli bacterium]|nr:hypothetical protein [Bacilli bacterium]
MIINAFYNCSFLSNSSFFIKEDEEEYNVTHESYNDILNNVEKELYKVNDKYNLSKNTVQNVFEILTQTREIAEKDNRQFIKLKDHTIKALVDFGVKDLPMLERVSHVRENIFTKEEALQMGFSIKNKHFHGLGLELYLQIMSSIDNPVAIYQYTDKGLYTDNNFIVVSPIKINGFNTIVPIEINQKGQFNCVEIQYNKIKTAYYKNNNCYIENLLNEGKIKEIFTGSTYQQTSLTENNIS